MTETQLNVKGMSCASCIRHVSQALNDIDGVAQVDVRLREGRVLVQHAAELDTATLCSAVEAAGYEAELAR